jgi:hypothetical protein
MMPLYDALGDNQPTILSEELDDIFDEIITETIDGSVIMIKGSNSVGLWKMVTHFKQLANVHTETLETDSSEIDDETETDTDTEDAVDTVDNEAFDNQHKNN